MQSVVTYLHAVDHSDDSKHEKWPECAQYKGKHCQRNIIFWPLCNIGIATDVKVWRTHLCLNKLPINKRERGERERERKRERENL